MFCSFVRQSNEHFVRYILTLKCRTKCLFNCRTNERMFEAYTIVNIQVLVCVSLSYLKKRAVLFILGSAKSLLYNLVHIIFNILKFLNLRICKLIATMNVIKKSQKSHTRYIIHQIIIFGLFVQFSKKKKFSIFLTLFSGCGIENWVFFYGSSKF